MSKSFIIDKFVVEPEQYQLFAGLTQGLNEKTHHLFSHFFVSSLLAGTKTLEETWVPVPWRTVREQLRGASWQELADRGLVSATDYSIGYGRCREYHVDEEITQQFLALAPKTWPEYQTKPKVNLMTGKRSVAKPKNIITDETGHPEPELVVKAMQSIETCIVDLVAIENHCKELLQVASKLENAADANTAFRRYKNDYICLNAIYRCNPVLITEGPFAGFFKYRPAYRVQMSGRISEIGGGMQSCSRRMKYVGFPAFSGLNNYDLKNSQPTGLIHQFQQAGLNTDWLEQYVVADKQQYADFVGIEVETWKECLCAVMMGAYIPNHIIESDGSVSRYLKQDELLQGSNLDASVETAYAKLRQVTAPLKEQLDCWHEWLLNVYVPKHCTYSHRNCYLKNATGKTLNLTALPKQRHIVKSVVAAFLLQGQEAGFIHNLTLQAKDYGFEVLSNQHDGLVTLGTIPQSAVRACRPLTETCDVVMVQKPFHL